MDKAEAIQQMKLGKKLTHRYFSDDEWVTIDKHGQILLEDGVTCSQYEFWNHRKQDWWNDGWSLFDN